MNFFLYKNILISSLVHHITITLSLPSSISSTFLFLLEEWQIYLKKIGNCWNNTNPETIKDTDTISMYSTVYFIDETYFFPLFHPIFGTEQLMVIRCKCLLTQV